MKASETQHGKDSKEKHEDKTKHTSEKKTPSKKAKSKIEKLEQIKKLHKEEIDNLKSEIEAKGKEEKENYDKILRLNAEFDNFRKRMQREKNDFSKYAGEKVTKDFLPIMDDLERAIKAAKENHQVEDLIKGIEMIMNQIKNVLQSNDTKQFDSLGQPFDPEKHEAVSKVSTTEHEHNMVIEELRKGYMSHNRLLRPAMVIIAENIPEEKEKKKGKEENQTTVK